MKTTSPATIHWLLRLAILMEFTGHGAFGIIGKESWIPFITFFGFPAWSAYYIMPAIGMMDIFLGFYSFLYPRRFFFLYMAFWGFLTASLRPLTDLSFHELIERSYNYCVPFMFLLLHGFGTSTRSWIEVVKPPSESFIILPRLRLIARVTVFLMLIGYGMLALESGNSLGWVELILAASSMFAQSKYFFLFISFWKLATEFGYVFHGVPYGWLEFIERGSAYIAPLIVVLTKTSQGEEREDLR